MDQNGHWTNVVSRKTEYDWKTREMIFQIARTRKTWSVHNISSYIKQKRWETRESIRIDRKYSWWSNEKRDTD